MAFRDRLKEARKRAGITQLELGQLLGVAKSTVSGYELGTSEPDTAKIVLLLSILKVDANYLWQDEMSSLSMQNKKASHQVDYSNLSSPALTVAAKFDESSMDVQEGVLRFLGIQLDIASAQTGHTGSSQGDPIFRDPDHAAAVVANALDSIPPALFRKVVDEYFGDDKQKKAGGN